MQTLRQNPLVKMYPPTPLTLHTITPAIESMVMKNGKPCTYDDKNKKLFVADKGFTVFRSHAAANSAVWHSVHDHDIPAGMTGEDAKAQYSIEST